MMQGRAFRAVSCALLVLGFGVSGSFAKSTKLVYSWKNPTVKAGNFKKVLVVGISANPGRRSDFEDALSTSLAKPGIEVIPGNTILLRPDTSPIDINYLRLQVQAFEIDAVVVSRLVRVKDSITYVPPSAIFPIASYATFYGYWGAVSPIVYDPGYLIEDTTVRIETNVYAITPPDGVLLWTATSDTFDPSNAQKVIKDVVKLVTKELSQQGIL